MSYTVYTRRYRTVIGLLVIPILFPASYAGSEEKGYDTPVGLRAVDVGMVALVATPETYDGKLIRTHGFLCIEFEGDAIYLHEEDYRHGLTKNSLALRLTKSQREQFKGLSLKYVVIEGKVYAKGLEATDEWSGAIGNITRLEIWPVNRGPVPHK